MIPPFAFTSGTGLSVLRGDKGEMNGKNMMQIAAA